MKQLLLLRHAKSSWDDASLDDFDRPLAPRGLKAAPLIGQELVKRDWMPQAALVSTAVRTRQTWQLVTSQWSQEQCEVEFSDDLYEASDKAFLSEARKTKDRVNCLLLLGHNPGLEIFAQRLASENSNPEVLRALHDKFPTCALARFQFSGTWRSLSFNTLELTHFIRPRDLN